MKKVLSFLLIALMLFLTSCGDGSSDTPLIDLDNYQIVDTDTGKVVKSRYVQGVLNTTEYALYQNVFTNKAADSYVGKSYKKKGTFTVVEDRFNEKTRYYVWGFNDNTRCCDWQWEFVPADASKLPAPGSLIEMTGTFVKDSAALDGYWFIDTEVTTVYEYDAPNYDLLLTTMSDTLQWVQLVSMHNYKSYFEGKTVICYGRIYGTSSIEDAYYSNFWTQDIASEDTLPAIGTQVTVTGKYENEVITSASVSTSPFVQIVK